MTEIQIYNTAALDREEWRHLQAISRDGFSATLDRPQDKIDALVEWNDFADYYESHVDPNYAVGKSYNPNQSYSKPRVAIATDGSKVVGFAYSAHNVSGTTERERTLKRLSVVKNYLWLREVAVASGYQGQGIARELGKALLNDAIPLQPPTAYVWPGEIPFLQGSLEKLGFSQTDEQESVIYGPNSIPVREVRMQATSAKAVLKSL
jgi:GNAT superfamily N-acetyltransferase